jgi:hypothetical protein
LLYNFGKADKVNLMPMYKNLVKYIRKVDTKHIIFYEPGKNMKFIFISPQLFLILQSLDLMNHQRVKHTTIVKLSVIMSTVQQLIEKEIQEVSYFVTLLMTFYSHGEQEKQRNLVAEHSLVNLEH